MCFDAAFETRTCPKCGGNNPLCTLCDGTGEVPEREFYQYLADEAAREESGGE